MAWLDNTEHYWLVVLIALFATTLLAISPALSSSVGRRPWLRIAFIVMIFLTLLAGRWPVLYSSQTLEFDESGLIAAAMTAAVNPIPWASFDPQTSGPLNVYFLDLPRLIGIPISYNSTHFMALLILWGMLVGLYLFARRVVDESIARISILPALIFLTFTFNGDFLSYATELPSLLLLTWGLVSATMTWRNRSTALISASLSGLAVGAVPFAKLQSVLLDAVLVAVFIGVASARRPPYLRSVYRAFVGGMLAPPIVIIAAASFGGAFFDFFMSYIRMPLAYVAGPNTPLSFVVADPNFGEYLIVGLSIALLAAVLSSALASGSSIPLGMRWFVVGSGVSLAVGFYTMFAPHKPWVHYVFYLLPTLLLLVASTLGILYVRITHPVLKRATVVSVAIIMVVPMIRQALTGVEPYVGHVVAMQKPGLPDPLVAAIRAELRPGDRMAVWGLRPDLFPETGALLGTRDFQDKFQMEPGPLQEYYRTRFVNDVIREKPKVFVDAVAPGSIEFTDRKTMGFETFPMLAAAIGAKYHLTADINGYRVYERGAATPGELPLRFPPTNNNLVLTPHDISRLRPITGLQVPGWIDGLQRKGVPGDSSDHRFPVGTAIVAHGWAVSPKALRPAAALLLIVDGRVIADVTRHYGDNRPDVAAALKAPLAEYSGFSDANVPAAGLKKGLHSIRFGVVTSDGRRYYLSQIMTTFTLY